MIYSQSSRVFHGSPESTLVLETLWRRLLISQAVRPAASVTLTFEPTADHQAEQSRSRCPQGRHELASRRGEQAGLAFDGGVTVEVSAPF